MRKDANSLRDSALAPASEGRPAMDPGRVRRAWSGWAIVLVLAVVLLGAVTVRGVDPVRRLTKPVGGRPSGVLLEAGEPERGASGQRAFDVPDDERATVAMCEKILQAIVDGNVPRAFEIMKPMSNIAASQMAAQEEATKQQFARIVVPQFGEILGFERVRRESPCPSVVRYTYILKCERFYVGWSFSFYRPGKAWSLTEFSWNAEGRGLFGG